MLNAVVTAGLFIAAPIMGLVVGTMAGIGVLMAARVRGDAVWAMRLFQVGGVVLALWFAYYASQVMAGNSRRGVIGSGLQVEDTYRRL